MTSIPDNLSAPSTFGRIITLFERERRTRFAGGQLGYLWAYITPVVWIGLVVAFFWIVDRSPPIYVSTSIFVATGILPYLSFRQTVTTLSRAVAAQRYLQYLRPVGTNDILSATMLLEGYNIVIISLLIFTGSSLIFGAMPPATLTSVMFGLVIAWLLGCGFGRFVAAIGMLSDSFARSVPLLLRPLFWLSGIFYTATELPEAVREILWFSPLLHITEIIREGYFLGYTSPVSDPWYPLVLAAGFFLAALPIEAYAVSRRLVRHRL